MLCVADAEMKKEGEQRRKMISKHNEEGIPSRGARSLSCSKLKSTGAVRFVGLLRSHSCINCID